VGGLGVRVKASECRVNGLLVFVVGFRAYDLGLRV